MSFIEDVLKLQKSKINHFIFSPENNGLEHTNEIDTMKYEKLPCVLQQPHDFLPSSLEALNFRSQNLPLKFDSCITSASGRRLHKIYMCGVNM